MYYNRIKNFKNIFFLNYTVYNNEVCCIIISNTSNFYEYLQSQWWIDHSKHIVWSFKSLDLTSLDFCIWNFVKNKMYVSSMLHNVQQLKERIRNALVFFLDEDFLGKVWQKLEFRWDVYRITGKSRIKHL